jgi:hypothetical protein
MAIGKPVGRTPAQLAKAAATKARARQFDRATSNPPALLGWKTPEPASGVAQNLTSESRDKNESSMQSRRMRIPEY